MCLLKEGYLIEGQQIKSRRMPDAERKKCLMNYERPRKNRTRGKRQMNGQNRKDIKPGLTVEVVLKQDQRTGKRTRGVVRDILTKSSQHPHGIKVRLETGEVGRVQEIIE